MKSVIDYYLKLNKYFAVFDGSESAELDGKKGFWRTINGHKVFIPEGTAEEQTQAVKAHFEKVSKYNKIQKKYFEPSKQDVEKFNEDYKKHTKKELKPSDTLSVGKTPDIYIRLNLLPQLPVKIAEHKFNYAMGGDEDHNIKDGDLNNLPELIADPIMIFKSRHYSDDKSVIAVVDLKDLSGRPVFAILRPTSGGINLLPSTYGRNNFNEYFKLEIKMGYLVYADMNRAVNTILPSELQLLKMYSAKGSKFNIAQKEDIVKSFLAEETATQDEIEQEIAGCIGGCFGFREDIEKEKNIKAYLHGYFAGLEHLKKKEENLRRLELEADEEMERFLQGAEK